MIFKGINRVGVIYERIQFISDTFLCKELAKNNKLPIELNQSGVSQVNQDVMKIVNQDIQK